MAHPLSPWLAFLRAVLAIHVIWPVTLAVVDAIRSGRIQGAPGLIIRRSERPGRFWFLVGGLIFLKGLAAVAAAFLMWIAARGWW